MYPTVSFRAQPRHKNIRKGPGGIRSPVPIPKEAGFDEGTIQNKRNFEGKYHVFGCFSDPGAYCRQRLAAPGDYYYPGNGSHTDADTMAQMQEMIENGQLQVASPER